MKISVVTISYNQAQFLRECMDSVLSQEYPDIEYIIVDPGSTDGSREIIESYGNRVIKVFEKDAGAADGLNNGFAKATGEILYFINSDDYVLNNSFADVIKLFDENPELDVLLAAGHRVDKNGIHISTFYPSKVTAKAYVNGGVTFFQQGMFFKTELLKKVGGFNPNNKSSWDGELLLSFILARANVARIMKPVAAFRIYPESITGSQRLAALFEADHRRMFQLVYGSNRSPSKAMTLFYRFRKLVFDPLYFKKRFIGSLN